MSFQERLQGVADLKPELCTLNLGTMNYGSFPDDRPSPRPVTGADGLAATCELMFLHVSDGRVSPMPPAAVRAVSALAASQTTLPGPGQAGRHVAIPARQPG